MDKKEALNLNQHDFLEKLQTQPEGLSVGEAKLRVSQYGLNALGKSKVNALVILARQFRSSLIYLLIIASIISYAIRDNIDGTVILVILLINALLGFFQEYKSEKIIEKLSEFISKQVHVKRDGGQLLVDQSEVVPGDVVIIHEGDIAPADMRLIEAVNLQVNESQLTGESLPVAKQVVNNASSITDGLVFCGSTIEKGGGTGVAYATGNTTEMGNIAMLSTQTKKITNYEKSLQSFSSFLIKIVLIGLALVFILKIILNGGFSNINLLLLFIIATAVAVVPEALPVIATVTLSSGAMKLAKKRVVVKRLSSLEDLGNIDLLCTDKTGTITENKMTINGIVSDDAVLFQKFAFAAITQLKGRRKVANLSYDDAFFHYISKDIREDAKNYTIVKDLPFDPADKRRRVILKDSKNTRYYLVVIGAPEVLLDIAPTPHKTEYQNNITEAGKIGLHHLAIAYSEVNYTGDFDILHNERNLTFLGYVSFVDPLRASAKTTIQHAQKLGIKIKILTGDCREVAEYIGIQTGLIEKGSKVYTGDELDAMSPEEFKRAVLDSNVVARVSPTQKYNIIKALKENCVVAYQGDGINDAPALKLADVAIAVNTATDIAKESADIILLNKSLEVIIDGIKYGRSIFVNINKYIKHTMISNFANFIALSCLYLISKDLPLLPVQVLLTSVITDVPLIMVSADTVEDEDVVRPEKHNVRGLILISLFLGIPSALFELGYFMAVKTLPLQMLQTSLYLFFTLTALIVFYSIRSRRFLWKAKASPLVLNLFFLMAALLSLVVIYIPLFGKYFSFAPLPAYSVMIILFLTLLYLIVIDVIKVWYYKIKQ